MTSSIDLPEESRILASSAGLSGATDLSESRLSRSSMSLERAARLTSIPLSFNCLWRLIARSGGLAVRNTFKAASVNTWVPISRPSATSPGARRKPLCRLKSALRTGSSAATADAPAPQRSVRIDAVTSLLASQICSSPPSSLPNAHRAYLPALQGHSHRPVRSLVAVPPVQPADTKLRYRASTNLAQSPRAERSCLSRIHWVRRSQGLECQLNRPRYSARSCLDVQIQGRHAIAEPRK